MLFFALAYFLINLFAVIAVGKDCAQLSSLLRSDYEYSASSQKPIYQDDYYRFNAGIGYSITADSNTGINAEVLMQSKDSQYTSSVDWNPDELSPSGVALTKGIARAYGLEEGDSIYSKHIVDGTIHKYTIEQILPELSASRFSDNRNFTEGMIIMGFDKAYVDNIAHTTVLYTQEAIDEISLEISETPVDILYRNDEISSCIKVLFPYCILFVVLAVLITILLVALLKRAVGHNFRRLLMLGFEEKTLNGAFYRLIFGEGLPPILIMFCVSTVISNLFINSSMKLTFLISILLAEFVTLFISANVSKRRLWR